LSVFHLFYYLVFECPILPSSSLSFFEAPVLFPFPYEDPDHPRRLFAVHMVVSKLDLFVFYKLNLHVLPSFLGFPSPSRKCCGSTLELRSTGFCTFKPSADLLRWAFFFVLENTSFGSKALACVPHAPSLRTTPFLPFVVSSPWQRHDNPPFLSFSSL